MIVHTRNNEALSHLDSTRNNTDTVRREFPIQIRKK